MNDLIIKNFKYFARFIPKSVLLNMFIQPDPSRMPGYTMTETEILTAPDAHVIPAITRYVVSINENFVCERIKNFKGFLLFVEYGKLNVNHNVAQGVRQSLSVTVAHPFSDAHNDNLNEALIMNACLEILDRILRCMQDEQHLLDFCPGGELIHFPVDIHPVDPVTFYGCGGWAAMFNNSATIL